MKEQQQDNSDPEDKAEAKVAANSTAKTPPELATGWKRLLYLTLAGVFFTLGALGAVIPGLPATPFLLLTSYFLLRSSPEQNDRLLKSRLVGPLLADWQERGGVRASVKWKAIIIVLVAIQYCSSALSKLHPAREGAEEAESQ